MKDGQRGFQDYIIGLDQVKKSFTFNASDISIVVSLVDLLFEKKLSTIDSNAINANIHARIGYHILSFSILRSRRRLSCCVSVRLSAALVVGTILIAKDARD